MKTITHYAVIFGFVSCLLAAIWSPEEAVKWVMSAVYLLLVGRYFGVSFRTEKVKGQVIIRNDRQLTSFIGLKRNLNYITKRIR